MLRRDAGSYASSLAYRPADMSNYAYLDHAGMPVEEWTRDEADPYKAPDDPDNWRDENEE